MAAGPSPEQDVLAAVRALLAGEVERVENPGPRPDDTDGWHPMTGPASAPTAPGHPVYDAEAWKYFHLQDLALLTELVLVDFTWTDPATPDLRYLAPVVVPDPATSRPSAVASVARAGMRLLLAPGWRERVERTWLGSGHVLIKRPRRSPDLVGRERELLWHRSRTTGRDGEPHRGAER